MKIGETHKHNGGVRYLFGPTSHFATTRGGTVSWQKNSLMIEEGGDITVTSPVIGGYSVFIPLIEYKNSNKQLS